MNAYLGWLIGTAADNVIAFPASAQSARPIVTSHKMKRPDYALAKRWPGLTTPEPKEGFRWLNSTLLYSNRISGAGRRQHRRPRLRRRGEARALPLPQALCHHRRALPADHRLRVRSDWDETLQDLLGKLGDEGSVWAELLFADPIADIAVLGSPDNQEPGEQAMAHEELVEQATLLIHRCPSRLGRTDAGHH